MEKQGGDRRKGTISAKGKGGLEGAEGLALLQTEVVVLDARKWGGLSRSFLKIKSHKLCGPKNVWTRAESKASDSKSLGGIPTL